MASPDQANALMLKQRLRPLGHAVLGNIVRRGANDAPAGQQLADDDAAVERCIDMQADIEFVADHVHPVVGEYEFHGNARIEFREFGDQRREPASSDLGRGPDPDMPVGI